MFDYFMVFIYLFVFINAYSSISFFSIPNFRSNSFTFFMLFRTYRFLACSPCVWVYVPLAHTALYLRRRKHVAWHKRVHRETKEHIARFRACSLTSSDILLTHRPRPFSIHLHLEVEETSKQAAILEPSPTGKM